MSWRICFSLLILVLLLPEAAPLLSAEERITELPSSLVLHTRTSVAGDIEILLQLQDASAVNGSEDLERQRMLIGRIDARLASLVPADIERIYPSMAALVLSGGDPRALRQMLQSSTSATLDGEVLLASIDFMMGQRKAAMERFQKISLAATPERLQGRIALARALLEDSKAAQNYYSLAIAKMPGTLVEESALRRSALQLAALRDQDRFWGRLERYQRRFPLSIYADGFWSQISREVVRWAAGKNGPSLETFDRVLGRLSRSKRQRLYLEMARAAVTVDSPKLTQFAGRRLSRLSVEGSVEERLGQFYAALFDIVSPQVEDALNTVNSLDLRGAGPLDRSLQFAAIMMGRRIVEEVDPSTAGKSDDTEKSGTGERGEQLLNQTAKLLSSGSSP